MPVSYTHLDVYKRQEGSILAFEKTGAYAMTEGMGLFLSHALPRIIFYSKKEGYTLARDSQPVSYTHLGMAVFGPLSDLMPLQWLMEVSGIFLVLLSLLFFTDEIS